MNSRILCLFLLTTALVASGCSRFGQDMVTGYLYTNTRAPYSIDLDNTPVSDVSGKSSVLRIKEPFTDLGIYTELNSNAIGDIARKNGMDKVYFADLETFSIFSVWRSQSLVIYGEKVEEEVAANK
jgi:hypothetical protein